LEAEMAGHLNETERKNGNKRNGKGRKTIKNETAQLSVSNLN
jgi:hypothetical protein